MTPKKQPTTHLTFLGDEHSGRDEMNLAGHPFALLQTPKRQSETSIHYDWERTLADGRVVTASWRVETPAAYGLPGPEEELVYLVLLQLTREAAEAAGTPGEWPLIVKFSRGDLLQRLGWDDSAKRYAALELAFNRLQAVSINARYAFHDARTRAPAPAVGFGILNEYSLAPEPKGRKGQGHLPLSHFEWNTVLHTSFLAGNVRSLALDFAISLQYPTARRLFRLLEVLRYATRPPRPQISIGIFKLRDRLGMTPHRYPSKICEKLAPAVDELTRGGYLDGMELEKDAQGAPVALFRFAGPFGHSDRTPALGGAAEGLKTPAKGIDVPDLGPRNLLIPDLTDSEAQRNAALDEIFAGLSEAERAEIEAIAVGELAPFLRENLQTFGAKSEITRTRRREVAARFGSLINS